MKKISITSFQLFMVLILFAQKTNIANSSFKSECTANGSPGFIKIVSKEEMTVTGSFSITLTVKALEGMYIDSLQIGNSVFFAISANSSLSKNQIAQTPHFGQTYLNTNETTTCNLVISHATTNLPYYPEDFDLRLRCHTSAGQIFYLSTNTRIYFTPYNSVEIWDVTEFMRLPRIWAIKQTPAPPRLSVLRTAIPVSTRPNANVITAAWQKDFQTERVTGLPYLIQMAALHPDTIKAYKLQDSLECVAGRGGTLGKSFLNGNTFKGQIKGKIKCSYKNDLRQFKDLFLSGVRIAAFDEDIICDDKLGETHTDENGYFEINYNKWQSGFEGDYIELFVQLWSENVNYDLDVISDHFPDNAFNITYTAHFWFGDTDDDENRDLGERFITGVDDGPFRTVHFASNAYRFCRANLPASKIPDGLNIFLYNEEARSYFERDAPFHKFISLQGGHQNHESVIYHEFGHYLMYGLQNGEWTENTGGPHKIPSEIHPSFAWTEGWATGIEGIFDAHYRWQDNESGVHGFDYGGDGNTIQTENRDRDVHDGTNTSGFKNEYFISTAINDLYDGPAIFTNITNVTNDFYDDKTTNSFNYANEEKDDLSLSFLEICTPLMQNNTSGNTIDNIYSYFVKLVYNNKCNSSKIKKIFKYNGVSQIVNTYDIESNQMSTDMIQYLVNVEGKYIGLDISELDGLSNTFNIADGYNLYFPIELKDNLTVRNGANLYLWGNVPRGPASLSLPIPLNYSSTKIVQAYNAIMSIESSSQINIGGVNPVNFEIKCGSELKLKNNSQLNITNNSNLIIESGAKLIFSKGATINLIGPNSIIIVKDGGKIQIGTDAIFNYNGEGFIRFETAYPASASIEAIGSNAQFKLVGGGFGSVVKKVMEVTGGQTLSTVPNKLNEAGKYDLRVFSIQNANIVLDANSQIHIDGTNTQADFRSMEIKAAIPNLMSSRHRGIIVNGQLWNSFYKVNITDAITGITARNFYGGNDIDFIQVTGTRCKTGIYAIGAGARIQEANFNNCEVAIKLEGMTRSTRIYRSVLYYNTVGVEAINCAYNIIELYQPHFYNNYYGIKGINSQFTSICGLIKNNSSSVTNSFGKYEGANVYLAKNSNLVLDPVMRVGAGRTDLGSTRGVSIRQLDASYGPYINQSASSLLTDLDYSITGTLAPIPPMTVSAYPSPLLAINNLWGYTSSVSRIPVNLVDYKTEYIGFAGTPVYLNYSDGFPLSSFTNCNSGTVGGGSIPGSTGGDDRMRGFINGTVTPINGLPNKQLADGSMIKEKIQEGYNYFFDISSNYEQAVTNLTYALNAEFTAEELLVWNIAISEVNSQLIEALSEGISEGNISKFDAGSTNYSIYVQNVINLQDKLLNDFANDAQYTFKISLAKASLLRMLGNRDASIQALINLDPNLYPVMANVRESYICMATKEKLLLNGQITINEFDSLYNCSNFEDYSVLPSPYIDDIEDIELIKKDKDNSNISSFVSFPIKIYPNPSNGTFNIKFKGIETTNYTIEIVDIIGKKVYNSEGMVLLENNIQIDLKFLNAGSYFLKMVNGKDSQIKQLVIIK